MGRYDAFKKAVELTIIGDPVTLASVKAEDGTEFHITPRKFSKENAAKIRRLQTRIKDLPPSLVGKIRKLQKEHGAKLSDELLEKELTDEEQMLLLQSQDPERTHRCELEKLVCGIARQDLSDEPGPMTEEIAKLILDAPTIAEEILKAVDELNPISVPKSSDSSGT